MSSNNVNKSNPCNFAKSSKFAPWKIYFLFFSLIFIFNLLLPEVIAESEFYKRLYSQKNYNSSHFDFSKFFIFLTTLFFGYVLTINKNNMRYIEDNKKSFFKNLSIFILLCVFFYFSSGITVLLGKYDYEGFCDSKGNEILNLHKSK
jgi:hypothetical protein